VCRSVGTTGCRGLGRRGLAHELRRKGVDDETAALALEQVDDEAELEAARSLVRRRIASTRGLERDRRMARLVGMLARKGYGAGTAYRVVREALAEQGADADELGPGADLDG